MVPVAPDFGRRRRHSTVSEADGGKSKHPLAVLDPLDYVQLTREGSGPGLDFCLRNAKGDRVLTATEEVGCCAQLIFGGNGPFDLTVCDPAFTEVVCGTLKLRPHRKPFRVADLIPLAFPAAL